jgi:hypothetical protein
LPKHRRPFHIVCRRQAALVLDTIAWPHSLYSSLPDLKVVMSISPQFLWHSDPW